MTFSVVVLPLPFGPMRPWICPGADLEIDAIDRAHAAEAQNDVAQEKALSAMQRWQRIR